jgi:hypothetical protein
MNAESRKESNRSYIFGELDWSLPAALPALAEPYGVGAAGATPVFAALDAAQSFALAED